MPNKVKLIIDTDLGADCDDAGALGIANALADMDEAQILAITHCTSLDCAVGVIDAINTYYGREIPIGAYKQDEIPVDPKTGDYARYVYQNFPHRYAARADAPDALDLLRKTLAGEEDGGIVLVAIGPLTNIRRLLESKADCHSPWDGIRLVSEKVKKLVVMGGFFSMNGDLYWGDYKMEAEYNILLDIDAAKVVFQKSPVPVIVTSYEIGAGILTGEPLVKRGIPTPVSKSYEVYSGGNRESWDLTAVLYAVRGENSFWKLKEFGEITVDDKGITRWNPSVDKKHSYLIPACNPDLVKNELNRLLLNPPVNRPGPADPLL